MRPPDQIPNRTPLLLTRGDGVYLWTGRNYSLKTVITTHEWNGALTLADGIGQMQVGGHQVITAEQFKAEQREEARERYKDIILHWERGLRKSKEIGSLIGQSARATGQMIAAAKRWKLIEPDKEDKI